MVKNEDISLLQKYVLLLRASGIPITKAFLYGSYARNDATDDSDIDVLLISEAFDQNNDSIRTKAWMATGKIDVRIEPYMVGLQKYLFDDVSPLLQVVRNEGIEI